MGYIPHSYPDRHTYIHTCILGCKGSFSILLYMKMKKWCAVSSSQFEFGAASANFPTWLLAKVDKPLP